MQSAKVVRCSATDARNYIYRANYPVRVDGVTALYLIRKAMAIPAPLRGAIIARSQYQIS